MSDVKALIAEARKLIADCATYNFGMRNADKLAHEVAGKLADALEAAQPQGEYHEGLEEGIKIGRVEAAQQAPAVDREALELVCVAEVERLAPNNQHAGDIGSSVASALLAFGVFQDAAEVESRGLEKFAQWVRETKGEGQMSREYATWALAFAQQVRESNA